MNDMLKRTAHLIQTLFNSPEQKPTRDGFGAGLLEAGEKDERVVALCADLAESTRMLPFKERFPERFVEVGVAEQNLAALASGFANYGKIPFIASYAAFSPGRNNEQIRTTISLNNVPVKIIGSHAGVSVGPDGATHQALEDITLMRVQPNMAVLSPCDAEEARKATLAAALHGGPVYIRLAREKTPLFTTRETPFAIGKAEVFYESAEPRVALMATGPLVYQALCAAHKMEEEGVGSLVLNIPSIKPFDEDAVIEAAKRCGAVVSIEEHQIAGGLGSRIAEVLSEKCPTPQEFIGVRDQFGQSGTPEELLAHYGMDMKAIMESIRRVVQRKP